eukprot:324402_1
MTGRAKRTLALADFLVAQTKPKDKVIIPSHLRFDGWLSSASQLRRSIMSTFREMERTKHIEHIQTFTVLKLRVSDAIMRILPALVSMCSNTTSIKMELEYPSIESIQYEMMHNRALTTCLNQNDDENEVKDDHNSLMVTEQTVIKYMRQLFHIISCLAQLKILFIRLIDFPVTVYQDYISMCFDLKSTNYKSFPSLKALTFPVDNRNIQVFVQTEYWSLLKHFVHEHHLDRFTLLLDSDEDDNIINTTELFNQFCAVFIPTLLHRKYPLNSLGILAQSPLNVLTGNTMNDTYTEGVNKGMCYSLIAPFFDRNSIHLMSLTEFNLYLPNPAPLEDMLDLMTFITESDHKLTKFRLELPHEDRYKKTKKLLELMAKFVRKNSQLIEVHFHVTSVVNKVGIRKLFLSVRNHPNMMVFEMSEVQLNAVTWNALIGVFDDSCGKYHRCNTNLQVFKLHFKYKAWHKVLENKKLNMSNHDPLRIIGALYRNQMYLYSQIKVFETDMKDVWNMSIDVINIMKSFIFNQTILTLKLSGLSHDIKKKNMKCFNWFHELMFNDVPINNDNQAQASVETKEQLLYTLDWCILRSHFVKRQLVFR